MEGWEPAQRREHQILGSVHEYHEALALLSGDLASDVEQAPGMEPEDAGPEQEEPGFEEVSAFIAAAHLEAPIAADLGRAFKSLSLERKDLQEQYNCIVGQHANEKGKQQSESQPLSQTRDQRVLAAHQAREDTWARQAVALGCRFNKHPTDVTLTRLSKFRKRQEKLNHIYKSQPVYERIKGPDYWQISLRNAYSRYIPVGNEFSGLFTELFEQPPEILNSVKGTTPLEIFGKPVAFDPSKSKLAQTLSLSMGLHKRKLLPTQEEKGRSWLQGSYLQSVEKRYAHYMRSMMNHIPETDELAIIGESAVDRLGITAWAPIKLDDVIARLQKQNPEAHEPVAIAYKEYQATQQTGSLSKEDPVQRSTVTTVSGPALRCDISDFTLESAVGRSTAGSVTVESTGSAAIFFEWHHHALRPAVGENLREAPFLMLQLTGSILPGERKVFRFQFRPQQAGIFLERWIMSTRPQLMGDMPLPQITVRGIGLELGHLGIRYRPLEDELKARQKARQVDIALKRILHNAHESSCLSQRASVCLTAEHSAYFQATCERLPPTYYNSSAAQTLREVYNEIREILNVPDKALKRGGVFETPVGEHFSGDPVELDALMAQVHARNGRRAVELQARISSAVDASCLPDSARALIHRAILRVLLSAVDGFEAVAEVTRRARTAGQSSPPQPASSDGHLGEPSLADRGEVFTRQFTSTVHARLSSALGNIETEISLHSLAAEKSIEAKLEQVNTELAAATCKETQAVHTWSIFTLHRLRHHLCSIVR